jgi:hypothetical protein
MQESREDRRLAYSLIQEVCRNLGKTDCLLTGSMKESREDIQLAYTFIQEACRNLGKTYSLLTSLYRKHAGIQGRHTACLHFNTGSMQESREDRRLALLAALYRKYAGF